MKKFLKNKLITVVFVVVILLIILLAIFIIRKKHDDKINITDIKDSLANIFYYLPENKYDDMNNISDYCKVALIYDTNYLKNDTKINLDGKRKKAYSKANVLDSLKKILGKSASINFMSDEKGDYTFLQQDNCYLSNPIVTNLSYDSNKNAIYNLDYEDTNKELYIKWSDEIVNGNTLILSAQAFVIVKSSNQFQVYVDYQMSDSLGTYESLEKAKEAIEENIYRSYDYKFIFEKENENYIWKSYERIIKSDMTMLG